MADADTPHSRRFFFHTRGTSPHPPVGTFSHASTGEGGSPHAPSPVQSMGEEPATGLDPVVAEGRMRACQPHTHPAPSPHNNSVTTAIASRNLACSSALKPSSRASSITCSAQLLRSTSARPVGVSRSAALRRFSPGNRSSHAFATSLPEEGRRFA